VIFRHEAAARVAEKKREREREREREGEGNKTTTTILEVMYEEVSTLTGFINCAITSKTRSSRCKKNFVNCLTNNDAVLIHAKQPVLYTDENTVCSLAATKNN